MANYEVLELHDSRTWPEPQGRPQPTPAVARRPRQSMVTLLEQGFRLPQRPGGEQHRLGVVPPEVLVDVWASSLDLPLCLCGDEACRDEGEL
jgi:hypothetical protein